MMAGVPGLDRSPVLRPQRGMTGCQDHSRVRLPGLAALYVARLEGLMDVVSDWPSASTGSSRS